MRFLKAFAVLLAATTLVYAAEPSLEQRVVEHTCPNGIKLLILERHYSPTVSIRMMFRTGSVDEVSGKTGLAHMFEHMMFKGTHTLGTKNYTLEAPLLAQADALHQAIDQERAKGDKADQALIAKRLDDLHEIDKKTTALVIPNELWNLYEREGASLLNAGTASDLTQYEVDLPSNKLELWAILDSDRVKNPVFRQFYSEREVVKEERRMRVDTNPQGKLYENFLETAYTAHPYHHPTLGWDSDLDHLSVADLLDFYHKHYTPDRLTISVVGDVKAPYVIALVDQYFGTWKTAATETPGGKTEEPPQQGKRRVSVDADAEPHLLIGFHEPAYPDPDYFIFSALAHLLSDGQSSRLYKPLVQKKHLASSVDADPATPGERYSPLFVISADTQHPHTAEDVEKAIFQVLEDVKKKPVEAWELEKVRSRVDVDLLNTLQTNNGMADTLVYDQCIFGDWHYLLKYQKAIETLTAADLQRVAAKIFRPENSTVAIIVRKTPEKPVGNPNAH